MHLSRNDLGHRLQLERKRIGLNQDEFAQSIGVAKRTLAGYEGGTGEIGAAALALAYELGVDVLYVLTGSRSLMPADALTAEETEFLYHYRQIPAEDRDGLNKIVSSMSAMGGNYQFGKR